MDLNLKLLIDVWDDDTFTRNDFIGYCELTIADLLECAANKTPVHLKPPPLPHNQDPGKLFVDVALLGFPKVCISISIVSVATDQRDSSILQLSISQKEAPKSMLSSSTSSIENKSEFDLQVHHQFNVLHA